MVTRPIAGPETALDSTQTTGALPLPHLREETHHER